MKPLNVNQEREFKAATRCYICKENFDDHNRLKLKNRDHSHFSGEYYGTACTWSNLLNRSQRQIPIYFHNFKGYDSKILISCIKKFNDLKSKINLLCSNSQNIRSLDYHTFRFCDSLEHMPASLDKLIQELNRTYTINDFTILKQSLTIFQGKISTNKLKLLCSGKQVYPYQLCNTHYEMEKITEIPQRKCFYNNLLQKECSESEYEHAKTVWTDFSIKNLKEYTQLYNHCDVLLLAEAFFLYRKVIIQSFQLDPSHFYGIPSLSYSIMLKFSKVQL